MALSAEFSSELAHDVLRTFFHNNASGSALLSDGVSNLYVALTVDEVSNGTPDGTLAGELASTNGYARQAVTFGAPTETASTGSAEVSNSADVVFNNFTGTYSGVNGFAIVNNSTIGAGQVLCYGSISEIQIDSGDTVTFAAGAIDISLD